MSFSMTSLRVTLPNTIAAPRAAVSRAPMPALSLPSCRGVEGAFVGFSSSGGAGVSVRGAGAPRPTARTHQG